MPSFLRASGPGEPWKTPSLLETQALLLPWQSLNAAKWDAKGSQGLPTWEKCDGAGLGLRAASGVQCLPNVEQQGVAGQPGMHPGCQLRVASRWASGSQRHLTPADHLAQSHAWGRIFPSQIPWNLLPKRWAPALMPCGGVSRLCLGSYLLRVGWP